MKPPSLLYPTGVLLGVFIGAGCPIPYPNHCSAKEGNATCAAGGQGTYCDECRMENDGCVNDMPASGCYFPGPNEEASTSGDGITSSETTTVPQPTTIGPEEDSTETTPCASDEDCTGAGAPMCDTSSGECMACDAMADPDGACAERDSNAPLCVDGECVQCNSYDTAICDARLHVCDGGSNSCVSCTGHGQCGSGACELEEGLCFPETVVMHVDGDDMSGNPDSHASIHEAVMSIGEGDFGIIVVHEIAAMPYVEGVWIDGNKTIALLAAPGESPILQGFGGAAGLEVHDGAALYVEGLDVIGNTNGLGVNADDAMVRIDRSRVVQNSQGGILVQNGGELRLQNCFIGGNGAGGTGSHGIEVQDAAARILYSTVARNDEATVDSISCSGSTMVEVRNSIVVGREAGSIDCSGITIRNSALDESIGTNVVVGAASLDWFIGGTGGNFHLTTEGASIFADIAQWVAGDPLVDIDGEARLVDGIPDYAGADRP